MEQFIYYFTRIAIIVLITLVLLFVTKKLFDKIINKRISNTKYVTKGNTVISILRNLINIIIYFISITAILNIFNINTTSILAVAGVGGMAIAFAAKSVVEDFITGAFILFEDQFNIGDIVTINGITGTVKFMGIRITKLVDFDGKEIIFPNSQIKIVTNATISDMRVKVLVNITSFKPVQFVKQTIEDSIKNLGDEFEGFTKSPELIGIEGFTDYSYLVRIFAHTVNGKQWEAQRLINERIIEALQKNEISFSSIQVDKNV